MDLQACFQRGDGDARPHGAGADNGDLVEGARLCRQTRRQLAGLALNPKLVSQGGSFGALHQSQEQLTFALHADVERQRAGLHRFEQSQVGGLGALAGVEPS